MANQPHISVGILSAPHIEIELLEAYTMGATEVRGPQSFDITPAGKTAWNGQEYDTIAFDPVDPATAIFEIRDVIIDVNFH